MIRKSRRFQVALVAMTIGLLALNTTAALAQMAPLPIPGVPAVSRPAVSQRAVEARPQMYSDLRASRNGTLVAGPFVLTGRMQYEVVAASLAMNIARLQLTGGSAVELAIHQNNLAWVQEHLGQMQAAEDNYSQALGLLRANGATAAQLAVVEYNMGDLQFHEHHYVPALHYLYSAKVRMEAQTPPDARALQIIHAKYNQVRRLILADPHVVIRM